MLEFLTGGFSIKWMRRTEQSSHLSTEKGMPSNSLQLLRGRLRHLLFHNSKSSLKAGTVQRSRNVTCCQIQTFDLALWDAELV